MTLSPADKFSAFFLLFVALPLIILMTVAKWPRKKWAGYLLAAAIGGSASFLSDLLWRLFVLAGAIL